MVVLFGGRSGEHSVSCNSAASVLRNLPPSWEAVPVGITPEGAFTLYGFSDLGLNGLDSNPADLLEADIAAAVAAGRRFTVPDNNTRIIWPSAATPQGEVSSHVLRICGAAKPGFSALPVLDERSFDLVFPVLHGRFGEDGTVQGMLELANIPFVGSGVLASALALDKHMTKRLLVAAGLPTLPYVALTDSQAEDLAGRRSAITAELGPLPWFVKPSTAGSSLGCSWVESFSDLSPALREAFRFSTTALLEPALRAKEVVCGVLEDNGKLICSQPAEVIHRGQEFFDYEAKYDCPVAVQVPANLADTALAEADPQQVYRRAAELAAAAHRLLGCRSMSRVDFFLSASGPLISEVNTIPGFTARSTFARSLAPEGLEFTDILLKLFANVPGC